MGIVSGIVPAFVVVGGFMGLAMASLLIGPLASEAALSKPLSLRVALVLGYILVLAVLVLLLAAAA